MDYINNNINNMETLKQNAAWIRTKIKRCYHADKFIQAEKYEYELQLIEEQIKKQQNGN